MVVGAGLPLDLPLDLRNRIARLTLEPAQGIAGTFLLLNLILAIFNLIPLPPLDGAGVVKGLFQPARALMELIVIKVGLDAGIIGPQLFTMLMVMAILTTVMTGPLLTLFAGRQVKEDIALGGGSAGDRVVEKAA